MTTPDRTRRTTWEMDQDPALAGAPRQRMPSQEFTEAIQAAQASNTEMMTGQAGPGETVQEAIRAVTGNVREMVSAAQQMGLDIGQLDDRANLTELQIREGPEITQGQINALRETVDTLAGPGYEMKAASNLRSLRRPHLGLRNARILKGPGPGTGRGIHGSPGPGPGKRAHHRGGTRRSPPPGRHSPGQHHGPADRVRRD